MRKSTWTDERARLNHDILRNQVLTELAAIQAAPESVTPHRLIGWTKQGEAYRRFFDATINALDPSDLLDSEVFRCWTHEQREHWKPIFREIFMADNRIPECVAELHRLLVVCEERGRSILALDAHARTGEMLTELEKEFLLLSRHISALPRQIGTKASD